MLTRVLLTYFAKTTAVVLLLAFGISMIVLGDNAGSSALASGLVVALDGAAIIWIVGVLLDPGATTTSKATVVTILMVKLAAVAGLLWYLHAVWGAHELGMLIGIAAALLGLVLGVNRGSRSAEGRHAIAEAEKEIAQEMRDIENESK